MRRPYGRTGPLPSGARAIRRSSARPPLRGRLLLRNEHRPPVTRHGPRARAFPDRRPWTLTDAVARPRNTLAALVPPLRRHGGAPDADRSSARAIPVSHSRAQRPRTNHSRLRQRLRASDRRPRSSRGSSPRRRRRRSRRDACSSRSATAARRRPSRSPGARQRRESCTERTPGGHGLLEAVPRIYQVTPDIPDRRRATKQKQVRPSPADSLNESQLAARSGPSPPGRTSPTKGIQTASLDA
jgi:hypothetical protein